MCFYVYRCSHQMMSDYSFLRMFYTVFFQWLLRVPKTPEHTNTSMHLHFLSQNHISLLHLLFIRLYYCCLKHPVYRDRTEFPWNSYSPHPHAPINRSCRGTALNETRYSLNSWLKMKLNTTQVFQRFEIVHPSFYLPCFIISHSSLCQSKQISKAANTKNVAPDLIFMRL